MRRADQRGMTLVEVLAALLLFGLIVAIATMVMSQVGSFTSTTTMRELDDMAADGAMRKIREELSQASEVYYRDANELRYRQNILFHALRFDLQANGSYAITRYDFYDDPTKERTVVQAAFTDPDVSMTSHGSLYTNPLRIGTGLRAFSVWRQNGSDPDIFVGAVPPASIQSGNIQLHFTFDERRNRAGTAQTITTSGDERRLTINLLNDGGF